MLLPVFGGERTLQSSEKTLSNQRWPRRECIFLSVSSYHNVCILFCIYTYYVKPTFQILHKVSSSLSSRHSFLLSHCCWIRQGFTALLILCSLTYIWAKHHSCDEGQVHMWVTSCVLFNLHCVCSTMEHSTLCIHDALCCVVLCCVVLCCVVLCCTPTSWVAVVSQLVERLSRLQTAWVSWVQIPPRAALLLFFQKKELSWV